MSATSGMAIDAFPPHVAMTVGIVLGFASAMICFSVVLCVCMWSEYK